MRKQLPEEKELRLRLKKLCGISNTEPRIILRDLTALVRAVRADEREGCAKVADGYRHEKPFECEQCFHTGHIAAAIRGRAGK